MAVMRLKVPARAPAGAPELSGGRWRWYRGWEGRRSSSPRLPAPHTQVPLSAGVLLQLLAGDWFNYLRAVRLSVKVFVSSPCCLLPSFPLLLQTEKPKDSYCCPTVLDFLTWAFNSARAPLTLPVWNYAPPPLIQPSHWPLTSPPHQIFCPSIA